LGSKKLEGAKLREGKLKPTQLAETDRDYYLERRYLLRKFSTA
jgi:succinate dehydrogenase / fumarate reductase flavoprotein subunit